MGYNILSKYRTELMGVAILWVMLFHSGDLGLGLPILDYIRSAGFGGVDIFILLSAMGLVVSLSRREQDYTSFMARRASRILPAYYLVMIPYTIFYILTRHTGWSGLVFNCLLLYYWVRPSAAFNWYVAGIMTFYAVTPMCFRSLRRSRRRELWTAAAVLASVAAYTLFIFEGYWSIVDVAYRVPVFFIGLLLGFYVAEDRRLGWKDILFWCVWLALGVIYLWKIMDLFSLPLCCLFLFTTVPMCFALCGCFQYLPLGWLWKFFRFLGTYSLEIYLLNVSFFSEVAMLRQVVSFGPSNRLYYLLSYICNIAGAVLLHKAVELLRRLWARSRTKTAGSL